MGKAKSEFYREGYTVIRPKGSDHFAEKFVDGVKSIAALKVDEANIHRDAQKQADEIYVKTSRLKREIEKELREEKKWQANPATKPQGQRNSIAALLSNNSLNLHDLHAVRYNFRMKSSIEESEPVGGKKYVEKTEADKSTFVSVRKQGAPSSMPYWIKMGAIPVSLATVVGAGTFIAGRALRPAMGLVDGAGERIEGAADFNSSGMGRDRQDEVNEAVSGIKIPKRKLVVKPADSQVDKEKVRREEDTSLSGKNR